MTIDQVGEENWQDLFPLLTECTAETQCNTTGFFDHLKYQFVLTVLLFINTSSINSLSYNIALTFTFQSTEQQCNVTGFF